jgi:hypothetical protein
METNRSRFRRMASHGELVFQSVGAQSYRVIYHRMHLTHNEILTRDVCCDRIITC